jgi:hypothetical protein
MFKLTCTYKERPAAVDTLYKIQVVSGRCRIFSVCLPNPTSSEGSPGTSSEVWIFGKDGYAAGNQVCRVFANMNAKAVEGTNSYVDFPSEGILCEDGAWVWMNQRDPGIAIFHNGGSAA